MQDGSLMKSSYHYATVSEQKISLISITHPFLWPSIALKMDPVSLELSEKTGNTPLDSLGRSFLTTERLSVTSMMI